MRSILLPGMIAAALLLGCGKDHDGGGGGDAGGDHEGHAHHHVTGPHGGEIAAVEGSDLQIEVVISHDTKQMVLWLHRGAGSALSPQTADAAPVLLLPVDGSPVEVTGKPFPEEGPNAWVFEHAGLAGEPEGARIRLSAGGKTLTTDLAHHHHH
jgi:hypothetical protein